MRCGYRFSELAAMSIEEVCWRADEERAYEEAIAKKG